MAEGKFRNLSVKTFSLQIVARTDQVANQNLAGVTDRVFTLIQEWDTLLIILHWAFINVRNWV